MLADGRRHEREGRSPEALIAYGEAAEAGEPRVRAEALRRKGAVHRRGHEWNAALDVLRDAYAAAKAARDPIEAAETLNAMGAVHLERGELVQARAALTQALSAGMDRDELRGRIEQNFGIIANIEGNLREAVSRYSTSLVAFQQAGDERGCAIAYHNLGMVSADEQRWDQADGYYAKCLDFAERTGDVHLRGCALLNRTEVHIARQHYEDARQSAESALRIFDGLGSQPGKSDAYKFLGVLYRETGVLGLAEARLKAAIDLAAGCGATLQEAEASRELALVYRRIEQNHDAVVYLNRSIRLFQRLGAQRDLRDVSARVANLESLFVEVVANWGRSLESADTYTFGHSGRVAEYAIAVARALGLDDDGVMTVRMGAYLHDLGQNARAPRDPEQADAADRGGVRDHQDAHPVGAGAGIDDRLPMDREADHPVAPREAGWERLSGRAERRRSAAARANRVRRGCLRCDDFRSQLSGAQDSRGRHRGDEAVHAGRSQVVAR